MSEAITVIVDAVKKMVWKKLTKIWRDIIRLEILSLL